MLELRTTIGLTQAALAKRLGVSRNAIGSWETGQTYPKALHLQELIALSVEQQTFPAGQEAEEIRALWQLARQKVPLDEQWLAGLLGQHRTQQAPAFAAHSSSGDTAVEQATSRSVRLDWDDALDVPTFYGRAAERAQLSRWVVDERCRVVSVLGLGGIGKSALAVTVMREVAPQFEVVIWRSVRDAPSCDALLESCLQVLVPQDLYHPDNPLDALLRLCMEQLRQRRVLLVLDNLEMLLDEGTGIGHFRVGFEGYGRLLQQIGETAHQSCVVLTSREKLAALAPLEGSRTPVRALQLDGLTADAGTQLLLDKDLLGVRHEQERLITQYSGNPLALKIVAQTIVDMFGGDIAQFFAQGEVVFGGVRDLLGEHFDRLSALEQHIIVWLAILREPMSWQELLAVLHMPPASASALETLDGINRRSLVERGQRSGSFTLQSVVLEYVTAWLIAEASDEIVQGAFDQLIRYGLVQAQAKDYVRTTQEQVLLRPLLRQLQQHYPVHAELEARLLALLDQLRRIEQPAQGYGPANLLALLRQLRGDLRGLDLSGLLLRGVFLHGVEMQDANLSHAWLKDIVFTEAFNDILTVAISPNDAYWAAVSRSGEIRIWEDQGRTLRFIWHTYADVTWQHLAWSPEARMLASGTSGGGLKVWDMVSGTLLWSKWLTKSVTWLAFSPNGRILAQGERLATVQLWNPRSGILREVLPHTSAISCLVWSPDGQMLVSGDRAGNIHCWQLQPNQPTRCVRTIKGHTHWVAGLAFAPDGMRLASASYDGTVKLWDVATAACLHTFAAHTGRVHRVAWSADGRTIASCGQDSAIRLWDGNLYTALAVLHGHASVVLSLAFTPDSRLLLSSSSDSTIRVWEVENRHCIRIIGGYVNSIFDIDWSPDSTRLASSGADSFVRVWDVARRDVQHLLRGHRWTVPGVGWHPNGQALASSDHENRIRVWDASSGRLLHELRDPDSNDTVFQRVAWSPDGRQLACGSQSRGVQVWELHTLARRWIAQVQASLVRDIAWSPDGACLAGGGDDGIVYLWNAHDGVLVRRLAEHSGAVLTVAWSHDGRRLASGASGKTGGECFVWNAEKGERVQTLATHSGFVSTLAWSLDGKRLISGYSDGVLRWWDVESGQCVRQRAAHNGIVQRLRCSPDGSKLASCGMDGVILLWDLQSGEQLDSLQRDRPFERVIIDGVTGITEAQRETLLALGAVDC
jgi:WD40 repeat protein/transcriptional regulator with XRE-family HTH domain